MLGNVFRVTVRSFKALGCIFLFMHIVQWKIINCVPCDSAFVIFFLTMYNKTIIRFGFCDMRNNQDLGRCYRLRLKTLTSTLIIPDMTKTSSNDCL